MLKIALLYRHITITKRNIVVIALFVTLVSLLQAIFLYRTRVITALPIDIWEFMLLSLGGVKQYYSFLFLLGWMFRFFPLLYINYQLFYTAHTYDPYVYTRLQTRWRWWIGKTLTHIWISVIYALSCMVIYFSMGLLFFPWSTTVHTKVIMYADIDIKTTSPLFLLIVAMVIITGYVAFSVCTQCISSLFNHHLPAYILWTSLTFALVQLYISACIPRWLSPMMYASSMDLFSNQMTPATLLWLASGSNLASILLYSIIDYIIQLCTLHNNIFKKLDHQ